MPSLGTALETGRRPVNTMVEETDMERAAKCLLIIGAVCILLSFLLFIGAHVLRFLGVQLKLGRLPGDILIKRDNFVFYFPLMTGIVISLLLSAVLLLLNYLRR